NSSEPIFDVAWKSGFGSMISMHRAFKKIEGSTPGDMRGKRRQRNERQAAEKE
ncbi:MAG: AraC family transcriptional regulator, partial [Clostridiales bacterium]|nr:AraC family transcriptional regulator [Clostridiales bacterium]